jgi:hypothetical protein
VSISNASCHTGKRAGPPIVIAKAKLRFIAQPVSLVHRFWPLAGLATGVIVNLVWIGFLGYGFSKLAEAAFF